MKTATIDDIFLIDDNINGNFSIKIIGVGGGGGNAANHMYRKGINGVDFIICNTDIQALNNSPIAKKIQLGKELTEGRGAGNMPEIGRKAALENIDDLKVMIDKHTQMAFVAAGMGGGTGTGASPVIAKLLKELDILTVGIVTLPFRFEGAHRYQTAINGILDLQQYVDALLIIESEKLRKMYGNQTISTSFAKADDILNTAAKSITEIITKHGHPNVEFSDVESIIKDSGVAIMGSGMATGENRAKLAINNALDSPLLLNDYTIMGAKNVLLNIISDENISIREIDRIIDIIKNKIGSEIEITWGNSIEEKMHDKISITIIATGFEMDKSHKTITFKDRSYDDTNNLELEINNPNKVDRKSNDILNPKDRSKDKKVNKAMQWIQNKLNLFDDDKDAEMQ